jgi:hypothetical protein
MKIKIEVTADDLEQMNCETLAEFEDGIRHQLDNGVVTNDGGAGVDWMANYELEIVQV